MIKPTADPMVKDNQSGSNWIQAWINEKIIKVESEPQNKAT